jgi:hypothetical protein
MAVTNSQAINFCNEEVRPAADRLAQLYNDAKDVLLKFSANGQNIQALIPNDSTVVNDGSELTATPRPDGRPPITGAHVWNIVTRLNEFVIDYEAGSNAKLNTVVAVAVNTLPR